MNNHTFKTKIMAKKIESIIFLSFFCLFTTTLQAKTHSAYVETKKFTINLKDVTLKDFITYIETHSEYVFFYQPSVINSDTKISIQSKNETINQVLDKVATQTNITYEIKDRQIVLKKNVPAVTGKKQTKRLVQGLVKDDQSNPIIGASIQIKGTGNGVITDLDGLFRIDVSGKETVLIVSYIGFITQEVKVGDRSSLTILLQEDAKALEEVVVTAFGVAQKKETMVGSVQQIRPSELQVPSSNLSSAFAGRMAGVVAVQRSGEPGADGANFWIRGKSTFSGATGALIVLDGVEITTTELNALDPEVIESFSILKDATATALYGTRGANGVMIVTTKSGKDLLKPIINVRLETAVNQLTSVPKMVGGVDYMKLYNEAVTTRNAADALYSTDKIDGTVAGLNPLLYPNVDWYGDMFNKLSTSQRFNFNIRGGKKAVTYFMSASIKRDGGNLKSLSKDYFSYDNNINVTRYDFVNNLGIQATKTTQISLGLNVNLRDWSGPSKSANDIFSLSREASPVDFPVRFPAASSKDANILWGGMGGGIYNNGYRNPIAEYVTGYKDLFTSTINANLRIEQDLKSLLDGLSLTALVSFKNKSETSVIRKASYNQYQVSRMNEDGTYELERVGKEQNTALATEGDAIGNRRLYIQAYLNYQKTFGSHDINAMLLYNQDEVKENKPTTLLESLPERKQGIAGRISYGYDYRYMIEANFGYNGSENFAKGKRFGFFPSVAVGYVLSQEKYWKPLQHVLPLFKLRASWGLVGNDQTGAGRFAYLEDIALEGSSPYVTGIVQNTSLKGPGYNRFYNDGLTWEVGEKFNVGLDARVFEHFDIHIDAFKEVRSDIFVQRVNTIPGFIGTGTTKIFGNVGKMKNVGMDLSLDYNKQFNKNLFLSFKGTFTYAHNTVLYEDEPVYALYPNLSRRGHSMDQYQLYVSNGLFINPDDVMNSPNQQLGYVPLPGDIKYLDIPNAKGQTDNVIDNNDRVYMGNPSTPEIIYGFGPSMKFKKWDLSFFFQGVAKTSLLMNGFHPFGQNATRGVMQFIADDRWTEANPNSNAAYPRLTRDTNNNNTVNSSFWLRNGAFLKLRNAEVGFTHKFFRVYLSGSNLLTFSPFKHWDPEMGGGSGMKYPTQRAFNIGVQCTFK